MLDQNIVRTGLKFGFFGALAGFIIILLLYFLGANPYGQLSWWGFLPIPVVIFWGISELKKQLAGNLGFLKALFAGFLIAFFIAILSALLLYIFGSLAGPEVLQDHVGEMKVLFGQTSAQALKDKVLTQETIDNTYKVIERTTLSDLVIDVLVKKFFIGLLTAIIGAIYFRK